jgi:hypothetical protein
VTAIRLWGPDPRPGRASAPGDSFLPAAGGTRWAEVILSVPGSLVGDVAHNAWGGRFESLPLPVFDGALIRVRPQDTPTPGTPTVVDTPTASATLTPEPTYTPSVTPSPTERIRYKIYLPIALRVPCESKFVEVVLVMDASSSMLRQAGDGGTKQQAVIRAAQAFVQRFSPSPTDGRIAVVFFNHRAWIAQDLTSDRGAIDAALVSLASQVEEGTRLDLGLLEGAKALEGAAPGSIRAMIFLTDGVPNRIPTPVPGGSQEDTVLEAAAGVRARGIRVETVGYGRADAPEIADRINPWLLEQIAGSPDQYHETDDAGALAVLFRRIAADVGCAAVRVWPQPQQPSP